MTPKQKEYEDFMNEQFEKFGKEVENKAKQVLNRCMNKLYETMKEWKKVYPDAEFKIIDEVSK